MTLIPEMPDWHRDAACSDLTEGEWVDAWFPEQDVDAEGRVVWLTDNHGDRGKDVCASCPVWRECVTGAVERNEQFGIWGGAGGGILRALRAAWRRSKLSGDWSGWQTALDAHDRYLADRAIGRRPSATNRNGDGATDGLRVTYARGSRSWASRLAAAANSRGLEPRRERTA